jgi:hypothetical protein
MLSIFTVLVLALGLAPVQRLRAQSTDLQATDVQQMQKKVEQMEEEIRELKDEINSAVKNEPASEPAVVLGTEQETPASAAPEKPKASTVDLYGFVMLDSGYDFGAINPNWFDVVRPTQLNAFPGEFGPNGQVYFSARQTRFGVKTFTPTAWGDLKTIFEFELFGTGVDAGQTTFRLRHAYGELGHFGAGQTWSPFMDIDVFPNSLEYWGPNGMVFFRNLQIRWMPIQGRSRVTIALERPGASADGGIYADRIELANVKPRFNLPDLSWDARLGRSWGYVQAAGIFRKIGWVDTAARATNLSGTAFGWGLNVSSNLYFTKKDTARLSVVYGRGIENYMNDADIDIGVKNNLANPVKPIIGVPLPLLGIVSFIDHNWSDRFSTAIGYSMMNVWNSNAQRPSDYHQGHYALTNLLFHPVKKVTVGGEFQFGRRVNNSDGFSVNDYRVQFSARFDWDKGFER